jgi:hypothetical protein
VHPLPEARLPEEEQADERRLQKERESALHRQGLGDNVLREARERGPVGPELELERDARNDAHHEGDGEDLAPEPRGLVVENIPVAHVEALEDEDEQREPHAHLGEQVMVGHGKRELQTRDHESVFRNLLLNAGKVVTPG